MKKKASEGWVKWDSFHFSCVHHTPFLPSIEVSFPSLQFCLSSLSSFLCYFDLHFMHLSMITLLHLLPLMHSLYLFVFLVSLSLFQILQTVSWTEDIFVCLLMPFVSVCFPCIPSIVFISFSPIFGRKGFLSSTPSGFIARSTHERTRCDSIAACNFSVFLQENKMSHVNNFCVNISCLISRDWNSQGREEKKFGEKQEHS